MHYISLAIWNFSSIFLKIYNLVHFCFLIEFAFFCLAINFLVRVILCRLASLFMWWVKCLSCYIPQKQMTRSLQSVIGRIHSEYTSICVFGLLNIICTFVGLFTILFVIHAKGEYVLKCGLVEAWIYVVWHSVFSFSTFSASNIAYGMAIWCVL